MRDPQDTKYVWDKENFKIIEDSISVKPTPEPDFATVLQFESMQNQIEELTKLLRDTVRALDEAREAIKEAWLAMDEIEGTDRMNDWQNKHATILEEAK